MKRDYVDIQQFVGQDSVWHCKLSDCTSAARGTMTSDLEMTPQA